VRGRRAGVRALTVATPTAATPRRGPKGPALLDHRRALVYAIALMASLGFVLLAVGRHPEGAAPATSLSAIGTFDAQMNRWMDAIRTTPLTWLFRFLNVAGGGLVTIPLRGAATLLLLSLRRWRAAAAFVLTWVASELLLTGLKLWFHRGRPPSPLVEVNGFSFPSGHAVAAAATGVALVLAFVHAGPHRRKWEWTAIAFAFVMAFSRVYLSAHWFSDVVAGVLLGSGIAIAAAALVAEIRDLAIGRRGVQAPEDTSGVPPDGIPPG
jgi:membrane-associated phospholipid phosphatase